APWGDIYPGLFGTAAGTILPFASGNPSWPGHKKSLSEARISSSHPAALSLVPKIRPTPGNTGYFGDYKPEPSESLSRSVAGADGSNRIRSGLPFLPARLARA